MPDHIDSDVLSIPSYEAGLFKEKLLPILSAKVVLVVEKDTLFSKLIQSKYVRDFKDEILIITVSHCVLI